MRGALVAGRAPFILALALVLTADLARSSLLRLPPIDLASFPWIGLLFLGILLLLLPAWLTRAPALPAAAFVTVPLLAASAYGASRLDWLRVLKDFGVAEESALDWTRLALGLVALVLLWALHAADLALRLRAGAIERGIHAEQASAAAARSLRRNAQTGAIALAGTLGVLALALVGLQVGAQLPAERGAFVVPLLAAALLVGAALYLARGRADA